MYNNQRVSPVLVALVRNKVKTKLKQLGLYPYIGTYVFLRAGSKGSFVMVLWEDGKTLKKGTTQGSVSGTHLFTIFLNDLEISLDSKPVGFKYADDTSIVSPVWKGMHNSENVVNQFKDWSSPNN